MSARNLEMPWARLISTYEPLGLGVEIASDRFPSYGQKQAVTAIGIALDTDIPHEGIADNYPGPFPGINRSMFMALPPRV